MKLPFSLLIALTIISCSKKTNDSCWVDYNCPDFATQADAQTHFNTNPECYKDLDSDGDLTACEDHNYTPATTGCPTTSNCGCSGKNKAPCESDPCCQWIVGTGCKCN
jgi:hypothetical protein